VKKSLASEFIYQIIALLISIIIVHLVYVTVVRPNAEVHLQEQAAQQAEGNYVTTRSPFVVIKDYEQETCFILMFWAMAIMAMKAAKAVRERNLLDEKLINIAEGTSILPEDSRGFSRALQALPDIKRNSLLPRALLAGLQRFGATKNIQDTASTVREICETEAERLDSELSMIRYIAWAIPSIGFIGTVRGIGAALGQAHEAVQGDISGVTASLGVAFNSTFIALVISILIMFLMYQLQLLQERLVLDSQQYCDVNLMYNLQVR